MKTLSFIPSNVNKIKIYLQNFRDITKEPKNVIITRKHSGGKNYNGLLDLGIKEAEAKESIFRLTEKDYSSGPEPDHDYPDQDVCLFAPKINKKSAYVKLTLSIKRNIAKVLSFHPPKDLLCRPFDV